MAERLPGEPINQAKEKLAEGQVILVLGASGLVGDRFVEMYGGPNVISPPHNQLDITEPESVREYIRSLRPDVVINFAAYTNVSKAEEEDSGLCWLINYKAVRTLLDEIDPEKTRFVQISTGYVFGGSPARPGPYTEDTKITSGAQRLTWYGYSKAAAEIRVIEKFGDRATILRIDYPVRAKFDRKLDYLRAPLDFYRKNRKLPHPLFTDQQITITFIDEACFALKKIIEGEKYGIYHAASRDTTTPYKLIGYYLERVMGEQSNIDSRHMGEYARRYPQFGGLNVEKTEKKLGMKFSYAVEIIEQLLEQADEGY